MTPTDEERLAELRRRVYAPGATEQDVRRYEAASAERARTQRGADHDAGAPSAPRRAPRVVVVAVVLGLAAAASVGAVLTSARPAAPPAPTAVPVQPALQDRFVAELTTGDLTELRIWFLAHADRPADELTSIRRTEPRVLSGVGSGAIAVQAPAGARPAGRLRVTVVAADDAPVDWVATDGTRTVASSSGRLEAGLPVSTVVAYRSGAPTLVRIDLPSGVRWAAFVAVST